MRNRVLLLTNSEDATSDYLEECLCAANIPVSRYNTDTDLSKTSFNYFEDLPHLSWGEHQLVPQNVSSIVLRRPKPLEPRITGDQFQTNHLAAEWREVWEGFLAFSPIEAWINHPGRNFLASHKIEQLSRANRLGLSVPQSLVTNEPERAHKFCELQPSGVIVKPLASGYIERDDPSEDSLIYTREFTITDYKNLGDIVSCPVLFQERIDKVTDVRVTALDGRMVAVGMKSLDSEDKQILDIRRDNMERVEYTPVQIPESTGNSIHCMLREYGLRFAAIDFAIQTDGSWVFFEINPNGQWAWLDLEAGSKIGNLFVEVLGEII